MNFDLDEDQRALVATIERLIAREYSFEQRLGYMGSPLGWDEGVWNSLVEIGLTMLPFSEEDGGLGGSAADVMLAMQSLGGAALLEPLLSSIVLCGGVLRHGASPEMKSQWIPRLADGSLRLAFAYAEQGSRHGMGAVTTRATRTGDGWSLQGNKKRVLHGDSAHGYFVTARMPKGSESASGIGVFYVSADAENLRRSTYALLDGTHCMDLYLQHVTAESIITGDAEQALENVWCDAASVVCWEAIGCMQSLLNLTVDYLKTRHQFGRPIGAFQTLQHRAVDMFIALEQARSMAMYAAMNFTTSLENRRGAVSAAKIHVCDSSRFISQQAIQLHGGIGMTEEYQVGHLVRRLLVLESLFGDRAFHMERLSRMDGVFTNNDSGVGSGPISKEQYA